jgi:hypothetical protein
MPYILPLIEPVAHRKDSGFSMGIFDVFLFMCFPMLFFIRARMILFTSSPLCIAAENRDIGRNEYNNANNAIQVLNQEEKHTPPQDHLRENFSS